MAELTNYRYGVIQSLDEAREAATEAESEDLRGYYPAACVVLARELKRWEEAHNEWLERSSHGVPVDRHQTFSQNTPADESKAKD